jgi:hypothetical protein
VSAPPRADNTGIADALERVAELYDAQNGDAFRVRAYRSAAATLRGLDADVAELWSREGLPGLQRLPNIGPHIARAIEQLLRTGRLMLLERLQGELGPERAFASVPGIGQELAHRIHDHLHIATLEELEAAAHDGRLDTVPGFGPRRVRAVREVLGSLLRRRRFAQLRPEPPRPRPGVQQLLEVDARYREGARADTLPKVAPRRFNPERTPWLPILHVDRDGLHYTALFSNTALAHKLGTTHDWVVIFYESPHGDGQCTVVTERRGPLAGKRVVRGREAECERHYGLNTAVDRDRSASDRASSSTSAGRPDTQATSSCG